MNEAAFLDAITSEPDELAHRFVYADWLEDQGDEPRRARAEFIRLQLERDALHPAEPRCRALQARERRLLEHHGAAWTARVRPFVRRCGFRRGFVEEVQVSSEQLLEHGHRLFRLAPVRKLQLRGTNLLPNLVGKSRADARALSDLLCRVRVLDLNRDYLGEAAGMALLNLPQLPRLDALHLAHNVLSPAGITVLAGSPVLWSLRTLEFTASVAALDALQALLHSPKLARLEALSLAGARLGDRAARLLAGCPLLGRLRSLGLGHNGLAAEGLGDLLDAGPTALGSLELAFNPLGVAGAARLAESAGRGRLEELNLSRTDLGDAGARELARSPLLGRLVSLDLSMDGIGPAGARSLMENAGPQRMRKLDLIYNGLDRAARARLDAHYGAGVCLFER
jgi:uncharacterized protein (TIGR02996 family)